MGTKTYAIPQGKFVFKAKANIRGQKAIYLQYVINSKPVFRTTGIYVEESEWDAVKQIIKSGRMRDAVRLNAELQSKRRNVDTQIADFCNNGGILTLQIVKTMLEGTYTPKDNSKKIDIVQYALDYNERRYETHEITEKTRYNHEKAIEAFSRYLENETGSPKLSLASLTIETFDKYKEYCVSKLRNKPVSVNKKLEPLSKAVVYASKNELVPISLATLIQEVRFNEKPSRYNPEEEEEKVKFLSQEQLTSFIELYHDVKYSRTRDFMDMFLFSFHACGLRVSDVITLEWKQVDFENKELAKILVKNKRNNVIPLSDAAITILKKWQSRGNNSRFVFNMLPKGFDLQNDKLLTKTVNNKNRTIRASLNEIGRKLSPKFDGLGMHVARHTFAVMALNDKGVDLYTISRLLGHSSVVVTEKVYATFLQSTLKKEVREKLSFTSFVPED